MQNFLQRIVQKIFLGRGKLTYQFFNTRTMIDFFEFEVKVRHVTTSCL